MSCFRLSGIIVDVLHRRLFPGTVTVEDGKIRSIQRQDGGTPEQYILPGLVDAHIHLESSLFPPTEFARLATVHGTVATVSDPHEIANVLGLSGIHWMVSQAAKTPMEIAFGAPSCVPATTCETAGATLSIEAIRTLFEQEGLTYLSEMMNVPGVLARDGEVMAKIALAREFGYPIDGHAPGLRGDAAQQYAAAQISTDHECFTLEEALDKLAAGMKILMREGSAAKNFEALHPLIDRYPDHCMFCSDDRHPDDLVNGHINRLVQRSIALGHDVMNVLQIACVNPVQHYGLKVGLLQVGDPADLIVVNNLQDFQVQQTYCKGQLVAKNQHPLLPHQSVELINNFHASEQSVAAFTIPVAGREGQWVRVMQAIDGQLITPEVHLPAFVESGFVQSDLTRDVLKIAVVNRYNHQPPALGLVQNFGLRRGAIASSVAHDSHNIVAVGTTDKALCAAVNAVIRAQGGIAVVEDDRVEVLPLPIAGLMSDQEGYGVAAYYAALTRRAQELGSSLTSPFMTLSFMALLVIPELKLSDRGLFSNSDFQFVPLWVDRD